MTIDISLLLEVNGIKILNGNRRVAAMLSSGMNVPMVDQTEAMFQVAFRDGGLVIEQMSGNPSGALHVHRQKIEPVAAPLDNENKLGLLPARDGLALLTLRELIAHCTPEPNSDGSRK